MSEGSGLRERKKAETRSTIRQAVLLLALRQGIEHVTVEQVAAEADVSVRTFHNYFSSKTEALTEAWRDELEIYVDALRERPRDESILTSLEHVLSSIVARMGQRPGRAAASADLLGSGVAILWQRSALLSEAVRLITNVVAERTGTDATTDIYPHLVTEAAISALTTTFQFAPAATSAEREQLLHRSFALLRAGLQDPQKRSEVTGLQRQP
jgi:AcrR family transcriptional regulator